jgi:drug/metabolite transporter (DMT)-like permease
MSTLATCLWIGSVLLDTAGRLAFKSAAVTGNVEGEWQRWKGMLRSPTLWAGILCFCLEFIVWLALLSLIPLSQAILIGSINIVVVALAGRVFFRERLDATRVAGFALIAVGVALAGGFA